MKQFLPCILTLTGMLLIGGEAFPRQMVTMEKLPSVPHKAPLKVQHSATAALPTFDDIISEAPEGVHKSYYRNGTTYTLNIDWDNLVMVLDLIEDEYVVGDVVEGNDGYYYFRNPVLAGSTSSYMKGEKEGNEIVFHLPQAISEIEGLLIGVSKMEIYEDSFMGVSARMVEDNNEVRFTINEDGSYTQVEEENCLLGYYYVDDDTWTYLGTTAQTYYPFEETAASLPSSAEACDGQMISGDNGYKVKIAIDGDNFYLSNLYPVAEEGWVVGNIADGKVTFNSYQYLGASEEAYHYVFFVGADVKALESEVENSILSSITFNYNADTRTLTPAETGQAIVANASAQNLYWLSYYADAVISPFTLAPATPRNPEITDFVDNWDYGYAIMTFKLPLISTDGNLLSTDHYYYNIYADEEPFILYPDEYESVSEIMEDVPYSFSDDEAIYMDRDEHCFTFYSEVYDSVGVQAVYTVDGITNRSDIVYYSLSGVDSVNTDKVTVSEEYYDISGLRVSNPASGLYIKKSMFSDGTYKVSKVIRH